MAALRDQLPPLWHNETRAEDLITQALMARYHFTLDEHFVIEDDKIIIVDEGTGRQQPGRSWSYGLQQAIEAENGVPLTDPSKTQESMSFQNYFQSYPHLCGASGTLQQTEYELWQVYRRQTVRIPSRKPSQLRVQPWRFYSSSEQKLKAAVDEIERRHRSGQPVLVGTRRVIDSEQVSNAMTQRGIPHVVLNAKTHAVEADIVANAGQLGSVCVATNMAGRGTDIKVSDQSLTLGGLCVIAYEQ